MKSSFRHTESSTLTSRHIVRPSCTFTFQCDRGWRAHSSAVLHPMFHTLLFFPNTSLVFIVSALRSPPPPPPLQHSTYLKCPSLKGSPHAAAQLPVICSNYIFASLQPKPSAEQLVEKRIFLHFCPNGERRLTPRGRQWEGVSEGRNSNTTGLFASQYKEK